MVGRNNLKNVILIGLLKYKFKQVKKSFFIVDRYLQFYLKNQYLILTKTNLKYTTHTNSS